VNRSGFILAVEPYLIRKGLASLLNRLPGVRVLKEFDNAPRLTEYLENQCADYLIISQLIFDQASDLFISRPGLLEKTILVTDQDGEQSTRDAWSSIHHGERKETILEKIKGLLDTGQAEPAIKLCPSLSKREVTIVRMISLGLTNKQIADRLFLSTHTVITHRKNISSKLGIKSVSGLTIYAIVNNIITIGEVP
jgi:DNA-binding CsgD family transcriptional regulator